VKLHYDLFVCMKSFLKDPRFFFALLIFLPSYLCDPLSRDNKIWASLSYFLRFPPLLSSWREKKGGAATAVVADK
jgi:hypothetical protein